ncbi:MAG: hypothetical protein PF638_06445 [Candidatus Delongbacteria bacterium]|jgi:hypothetical protein|nr:hypothetical protein [Candidatus Delongbacteria bacterium]
MKSLLSILLVLIISIFGMSGDNNEETLTKNNEIFIDKCGINTGMSQKEYENFRTEYLTHYKKKHGGYSVGHTWDFDYKYDFTKFKEFKELGVFDSPVSYKEATLSCNIVVIGKTLKRDKNIDNKHVLEIEEILKGEEIFLAKLGELPKHIFYPDLTGGPEIVAGEIEPVAGVTGLYFLVFADELSNSHKWLQTLRNRTILKTAEGGIVYSKHWNRINNLKKLLDNPEKSQKMQKSEQYRKKIESTYRAIKLNETWDQAIDNVKEIIRINNHKNFYKKSWTND